MDSITHCPLICKSVFVIFYNFLWRDSLAFCARRGNVPRSLPLRSPKGAKNSPQGAWMGQAPCGLLVEFLQTSAGSAVAAPPGAAFFRHFQIREFAVRGLHELLEPGLEVGRTCGLRGSPGVPAPGGAGMVAAPAAACAAGIPTEIRPVLPVSAGALGPGRRGRGFLHGQIVLPRRC